jgi:hypothetical protein
LPETNGDEAMTTKLTRSTSPGSRELLTRILEQPDLVAAVQALPAQALGKLINHVGLEDSGEIVALATTEQLRRIFDDDLWRSERPGKDESFDADRFTLWLEIMLEAGEVFTAQKLAELPEDLVTLALHKHILVIDIDQLGVTMSNCDCDDYVLVEKALASCLYEEIGEYRLISRRHDGWDAIVSVLLALDRDHHDFLERVLGHCCYMDQEYIEENGGLYDVLTSEDMLESDVSGDREDRRAEEGFIAPSSAASFLALARTTELDAIVAAKERDPVTRAYFRGLRTFSPPSPGKNGKTVESTPAPTVTVDLVELLRDADVLPPATALPLLESVATSAPETLDQFSRAICDLREKDAARHGERMQELAFLANVLVAGCSIAERSFRPVETANASVAVCNLGLEYLLGNKAGTDEAADLLYRESADKLFRIGWRLLHQEVIVPTARACERLLVKQAQSASDTRALNRATTALHAALVAGKPWTARQGLTVLEELIDPTTLVPLMALLAECPSLCGKLHPREASKEANPDLVFIANHDQIRFIQAFLDCI